MHLTVCQITDTTNQTANSGGTLELHETSLVPRPSSPPLLIQILRERKAW